VGTTGNPTACGWGIEKNLIKPIKPIQQKRFL
jgi:hypothetical protein